MQAFLKGAKSAGPEIEVPIGYRYKAEERTWGRGQSEAGEKC